MNRTLPKLKFGVKDLSLEKKEAELSTVFVRKYARSSKGIPARSLSYMVHTAQQPELGLWEEMQTLPAHENINGRINHIDVRYHYLRDPVEQKATVFEYSEIDKMMHILQQNYCKSQSFKTFFFFFK